MIWILIGVPALTLSWLALSYNRFVQQRSVTDNSWANVESELQRRHNLIPNLVETVKGYAEHERETLERVVEMRNVAMGNRGSAESQGRDESQLGLAMKTLFAVVEGYPQLKSDANFRVLQEELAITEDRIAAARRFFNGNVRDLRNILEAFPTRIVGASMGVKMPTFFELTDESERVVPRVDV